MHVERANKHAFLICYEQLVYLVPLHEFDSFHGQRLRPYQAGRGTHYVGNSGDFQIRNFSDRAPQIAIGKNARYFAFRGNDCGHPQSFVRYLENRLRERRVEGYLGNVVAAPHYVVDMGEQLAPE